MKTIGATLTLAALLAAGAAHADRSQLVAHLGLSAEEAASLSLSEIAALKFNRDSDGDNQQSVRPPMPTVSPANLAFQPDWGEADKH